MRRLSLGIAYRKISRSFAYPHCTAFSCEMTKAEINERLAKFTGVVDHRAKMTRGVKFAIWFSKQRNATLPEELYVNASASAFLRGNSGRDAPIKRSILWLHHLSIMLEQ